MRRGFSTAEEKELATNSTPITWSLRYGIVTASLNHRPEVVARRFYALIPRRSQRIRGHVQQFNQRIQLPCEPRAADLLEYLRRRGVAGNSGMNGARNGVQGFNLVDQRTEFGQAGNAFAGKITLPPDCFDYLAHDLRQPA